MRVKKFEKHQIMEDDREIEHEKKEHYFKTHNQPVVGSNQPTIGRQTGEMCQIESAVPKILNRLIEEHFVSNQPIKMNRHSRLARYRVSRDCSSSNENRELPHDLVSDSQLTLGFNRFIKNTLK